ncbi:MAG: immune inhibitor A [Anaerolineae bacterium]|nr:immune inhibitor A [Anaerolineae bacterium]
MQVRRWLALVLVGVMVWVSGPALAQEDEPGAATLALLQAAENEAGENAIPARDLYDLAARYRVAHDLEPAEPSPEYFLSDTLRFWVKDVDPDKYRQIEATLVGKSGNVYMWVENAVNPNRELVNDTAQKLDAEIFPAVRALLGAEPPGSDGDPHIYIVHTQRGSELAYFDDVSRLPGAVAEYSNEHDMIVVNLSLGPDFIGGEQYAGLYYAVVARECARLALRSHDADEDAWLDAGLAILAAEAAVDPDAITVDNEALFDAPSLPSGSRFVEAPGTQLTAWDEAMRLAHDGAAFLFALYVRDRFGDALVKAWAARPENGMAGLDAALRAAGIDAGAVQVFADWVMANVLNNAGLGEGQYIYKSLVDVPDGRGLLGVRVVLDEYPVRVFGAAVNPFGAQYTALQTKPEVAGLVKLRLSFEGAATVRVLPTEPHSGEYVYWSNRRGDMDSTLTRAFDLRRVRAGDEPALTFWAWYDIAPHRNYAYVAVSEDGGATWTALPATTTTYANPNRLAYGPGFTGNIADEAAIVPYAALGVIFETDQARPVIAEIPADSRAHESGLQVGDRVMAINGVRVEYKDDVREVVEGYYPGDVVTASVMRGGQIKYEAVTLSENPARGFRPAPVTWSEETVDLAEYAGKEILVRFEFVTTPGPTRYGIAIDDIALRAAGYFDDAESKAGGWEAAGWVRMDNRLPQRFIVQMVQSGGGVMQLLGADAPPTGEWTFETGGGIATLLAISSATPYTTLPGDYTYTLRVVEE